MYERFTDRARKVMKLASEEARKFNHEYVGTEHILLGLLWEGSGLAANVLVHFGVDLRSIRFEVEKLIQRGPHTMTLGKLPYTLRAKKVIDYSMEEARNLGHNYVGTEHILLGLLQEDAGVAAQVLINLGLRLEETRRVIDEFLHPPQNCGENPPAPQSPSEPGAQGDKGGVWLPKACSKCGKPIVRVLWGGYPLSDDDVEQIKSGRAILGSVGSGEQGWPWVCAECAPKWSDVRRLAMQDYELQLEKAKAIESQDFEKAAECLRAQVALRRQLAVLYEELLL